MPTIYDAATGGSTINNSQVLPASLTDSSLKGAWTFDGDKIVWSSATAFTATDDSGFGNTGSQIGTWSKLTSPMPGARGQALSFIAGNSITCGTLPAIDDLEIQGGGGMSVCYWVRPSSAVNGGIHLTKGSGAGRWQISQSTGSTPMRITFLVDGLTTDGQANFDRVLALNEWQHICITWNGAAAFATGVKLYRNGYEFDQSSATTMVGARQSDAANSLTIGGVGGGTSTLGGFDGVRLYNRVLTQAEVRLLCNAGSTQFATSPGHTAQTQTLDLFSAFNGTDGAAPTAVSWAASAHTGPSGAGTFSISPTPSVCMTFSSTAYKARVDPLIVNGVTYQPTDDGVLGLLVDPKVGTSSDRLQWTLPAASDSVSVSFDFRSTLPSTNAANFDLVVLGSTSGTPEQFVFQLKPNAGLRSHAVFGGSTQGVDTFYPWGEWVHVCMKWVRGGIALMDFYIGDELIGRSPLLINDQAATTITLGNDNDHGDTPTSGVIMLANLKIDLDGSNHPIVS